MCASGALNFPILASGLNVHNAFAHHSLHLGQNPLASGTVISQARPSLSPGANGSSVMGADRWL